MVSFCVEVAQAPALATVTRRRALDVVAFLARHKPKALLRAKLVQPLLRVLCPLCGEPKETELAGEGGAVSIPTQQTRFRSNLRLDRGEYVLVIGGGRYNRRI